MVKNYTSGDETIDIVKIANSAKRTARETLKKKKYFRKKKIDNQKNIG